MERRHKISLESVYASGDDALANMCELLISASEIFGLSDPLRFRTTTINIPDFVVGSYEVAWKTQKFEKPSGKDETQKTFDFSFRVDKYYVCYKALMAWWQYICSSNSGAMAEDVGAVSGASTIRTDIQIKTIDSNGIVTSDGFLAQRCWLKQLGGLAYDVSSGDPLSCNVTMSYVKLIPFLAPTTIAE
jgi:hypothetical protein